jgi:LmbE family N-acetylglucosaminyl deacetylase
MFHTGGGRPERMSDTPPPRSEFLTEIPQQSPPPQLVTPIPRIVRASTVTDELPIVSPTERHVVRLAAIESQIRWMGEATLPRSATGMSPWRTVFGEQGPFAIIKRKAGRFRLPRAFKNELLDRFCSTDNAGQSTLTTLIVVAHPDDESIGAGARLRHLGDAYVIDVTDGAPRDDSCVLRHGYQKREEYAEARRRELHDAMVIAGLPEDRLISLDFVDGEATLRLAELCLKVTELIDSIRPDVVLTHPYEGGHTDHDATAFAVHLACGVLRREGASPPAVFELTSYHARDGQKVVQEFLPHARADRGQRKVTLSEEDRGIKQRIFECFGTQRTVLEKFGTEFEKFRPAPRYVFTQPPHAGTLNYELYGDPDRGKTWREYAERALRILRMRRG